MFAWKSVYPGEPATLCNTPLVHRRVHAGLWGIGWRHAHHSDKTCIQIVKDMPLVSIYTHTAAFPSMAHLGVFDADTPIFCHTFDQTCLPLLIDFYILRLDLLGN